LSSPTPSGTFGLSSPDTSQGASSSTVIVSPITVLSPSKVSPSSSAASSVVPITTLLTLLHSTVESTIATKSNSVSAPSTSGKFFTVYTTILETINSGQSVVIKTCDIVLTKNSNGEYITSTSTATGSSYSSPNESEVSEIVSSQATLVSPNEYLPSELANTLSNENAAIQTPWVSEVEHTTVGSTSLLNNRPTVAAISKQGSHSFNPIPSEPVPNVSSPTFSTTSQLIAFSSVSLYSGEASSSSKSNSLLWSALLVLAYIL